jgi:hypothetical protein
MRFSDERIQSFIENWRRDFGELLTPAQANQELERLLEFFAALADGLAAQRRRARDR